MGYENVLTYNQFSVSEADFLIVSKHLSFHKVGLFQYLGMLLRYDNVYIYKNIIFLVNSRIYQCVYVTKTIGMRKL